MNGQRGAVLLLFVALLLAGAGALFVISGAGEQRVLARAADDAAVLARARDMVLGHALANPRRPGELPFPDRRADGNDDGNGDCVAVWDQVNGSHLLGHLPVHVDQGCGSERPAFGLALRDGGGHPLWYAVSRNLLYPSTALNSAVGDDWLQVHSLGGTQQAAFVVFAPGPALGAQQRSSSAPPSAYLDSIELAGMVHTNGDDDAAFVSAPAEVNFNDRLLAVSRSDFLDAVTLRVARTLFARLEAHRDSTGVYPWAALAGGACTSGLTEGFYPLFGGDCPAVPTAPPDWFAGNWSQVTRYTRVTPNLAKLQFDGCSQVFTITPLGLASAGHCT